MATHAKYILSNVPGFNQLVDNETLNHNILKLHKLECRTTNNTTYKVIRYEKEFLSNDSISIYGLCRSVIINTDGNVVGFAPPKSMKCDNFIETYTRDNTNVVAEEFVEGTMINVFWDSSIGLSGAWEIATRNTVGATSAFFKDTLSKTFREMFNEAAIANRLVLDNLDKNLCYSFVLQHPGNRIVVPFKQPQLYLVAVYEIHNEPSNIHINVYDSQDYIDTFFALDTTVKFPKIYPFDAYSDLVDKYGSMNTPYDIVGVVLHNKTTGERAKIRNPVYEQVRGLRGNQPKLQYHYLYLRKEGKVGVFLKYYPEKKNEFSVFRDHIHLFTNTLFANYRKCYIKKEQPLLEFSDQYRTHMYNIHNLYLTELRDKSQYITKGIVVKYVNDIQPALLMYCLNFHLRQRNDTLLLFTDMTVD